MNESNRFVLNRLDFAAVPQKTLPAFIISQQKPHRYDEKAM